MKKQRKQYAPEEKVAILRGHLLERSRSRSSAMNSACSPRSSTAGRRSWGTDRIRAKLVHRATAGPASAGKS